MRGKKYYNRKFDNNLVERLQGTVRDRNKTQRGLKKEDSIFCAYEVLILLLLL